MVKLNIPQELSDKISKSLRIKQTDIVDSGGNKPIIREPIKRNYENKERDSPVKKTHESTKQNSPKYPKRDSPVKKTHESPKRKPTVSTKKIFYKSNKSDKPDKINYIKISKIVFISSIIGGIGITLGIKLGTILFL
jgi:hypothetical protein